MVGVVDILLLSRGGTLGEFGEGGGEEGCGGVFLGLREVEEQGVLVEDAVLEIELRQGAALSQLGLLEEVLWFQIQSLEQVHDSPQYNVKYIIGNKPSPDQPTPPANSPPPLSLFIESFAGEISAIF